MLGVERQLGLRQPAAVTFERSLAAGFEGHEALFLQQVEAVLVDLQLGQQFVGDAVRVLHQYLQRLALARGAGKPRIVRARAGFGMPEALQPRFGRLTLAQQVGQRPGQRVAKAVLVVLRGPAAQLQQVRRQRRFAVEHGERRAQLVFRHLGMSDLVHQHADDLAAAERHAQAHAGQQALGIDTAWRQIVEQAAQRRGQGEAQDAGLGHAAASVAAGGGDGSMAASDSRSRCDLHGQASLV
ncbi:hypothetical protein D9M71_275340 [compost metagenome]